MSNYVLVDKDVWAGALEALAGSIRTKGGTVADLHFPSPNGLKTAVDALQVGGADVSGVTATAADVKHGKVIVGADGNPITGAGYMGFAFASAGGNKTLSMPHRGRTMFYADYELTYNRNEVVFGYYETGMTNGIVCITSLGVTLLLKECPVVANGTTITFDLSNESGTFYGDNGNQYNFVTSEIYDPFA